MSNIIHAKRRNAEFTVHVEHVYEDGKAMWVAVCDELGVVTESATYESLTARVWEIAPEMTEDNQPSVDISTMRLRFEHVCQVSVDSLVS